MHLFVGVGMAFDELLGKTVHIFFDDGEQIRHKKGKLIEIAENAVCIDDDGKIQLIPLQNIKRMEMA